MFILLLLTQVLSQEFGIKPGKQKSIPYFETYIYQSYQKDKVFAILFVDVSYPDLLFVKKDSGFLAKYDLRIFVFPENEDVTVGYVDRSYRLTTTSFKETNEKGKTDKHRFNLALTPGIFRIETVIRDIQSGKEARRKDKVRLQDIEDAMVVLSDIQFYAINEKSGEKIIQNRSNFSRDEKNLYVECEYASIIDSPSIQLQLKYEDQLGHIFYQKDSILSISSGTINFPVISDILPSAEQSIRIAISQGNFKDEKRRRITFYWRDKPQTSYDLKNALEAMRYIAPDDSIDLYLKKNFNLGIRYFNRYWDHIGSQPGANSRQLKSEFFKRVNNANNVFSFIVKPGFKSDPGRIYIKYGEPNSISIVNRDPSRGIPWKGILWEYPLLRKKFLFVNGYLDPAFIIYETD